jgi:uncharacterized heparinase superfamily protein
MNTEEARRYFHTLRSLRPSQVLGLVWKAVHRTTPDTSPAPPLCTPRVWTAHACREPSWLSPTRRCFLNVERDVSSPTDWNSDLEDRLWIDNLHYFEDLVARNADDRRSWHTEGIARWIAENPPGTGNGWEAYPLSLRIVNWIKWSLAGGVLTPSAAHSLAVQARFLRANLEHHLLGNHLFVNAKALVFAGCFFGGAEGQRWLSKGLALVRREIGEQVLSDGGHFERSPMYHSLFLEDLLDLINLFGAHPEAINVRGAAEPALWRSTARAMRRWLVLMTHPDGELALFNDCAFGVAPRPEELHAYARRLGLGPNSLPDAGAHELEASGFMRFETESATAILEVGEIGPSYLPGHAHADTLSFELSLFGERVVVDSGTSLYEVGDERLRQRSTGAHNTVVVDGADSSEVWSSFRVARRASAHGLRIDKTPDGLRVRCGHDGYMRLDGRIYHSREWLFGARELVIADRLDGRFERADVLLHLHPDVTLASEGSFALAGGQVLQHAVEGGRAVLEPSTWHPRFGTSLLSSRLRIPMTRSRLRTILKW